MRQALVLGWIAFTYLVIGVSPAHFWLDSGEIGSAGYELGVIHPPGAPGYVLLLRAATLVPLGSLGFRMAVLSAALGAVAVVGVFELLRRRGAHPWICWGAAVWLLAGLTFVRQARVVEIYALEGALLIAVLWGFDPTGPVARRTTRRLVGVFAAVWAVWCFGDLRIGLVVPVVIGWVVALRRGQAWARWAPLVVVMASAVVLCLPIASARDPFADWGNPEQLTALFEHVGAASIRRSFVHEMFPASLAMWRLNLAAVMRGLSEDLGALGPALVLISAVALWWPRSDRSVRVASVFSWLIAVEFFYATAVNPMGVRDRQTGMVFAILAALVVGEASRRFIQTRGRVLWAVVPLLWTVLVLPAGMTSVGDIRNTRSWGPHVWVRGVLGQLPPRALLLTQSDDLAAGTAAARMLEGARPDLVSIPSQHLYKPVPQAYAEGSPGHIVWTGVAQIAGEVARTETAISRHRGPVALEHPVAALHKEVRFWSQYGHIPVRVGNVDPAALADRVHPTLAQTLAHWLPRLSAPLDKQRLATALANEARAIMRLRRDVPTAMRQLAAVVEQVSDRHVGSLVALGALKHRMGDRVAAIELTRQAIEIEPGRAAALANLALYLGQDRATLDEAAGFAELAVALRPWRSDGWVRLIAIREAQGDSEAALVARRELEALGS